MDKKTVEEDDFYDDKKTLIKDRVVRVLNVLLLLLVIAWAGIVLFDYFNVRGKNQPKFCFWKQETKVYEDGNVESCIGLGYKVITYNRTSYKALEFGPFWITERIP